MNPMVGQSPLAVVMPRRTIGSRHEGLQQSFADPLAIKALSEPPVVRREVTVPLFPDLSAQ